MKLLLLFAAFAGSLLAQNPSPCTQVRNGAVAGQVLSAATNGRPPQCQWITGSGGGGIPSVAGTLPIIVTNGTTAPVVSCRTATGAVSGCLTAADWAAFNLKQAAGNYITALTGDGTASGPGSAAFTLATVNGNVGTFGDATHVGRFTVNAKGLVTAASSVAITGGGTPGGSTTQLQYNNAGAFGGITGATTNGTALTLVAPVLGTPASGTLTNTTGFPVANLAGAGTGVLTALATNVSGTGAICLASGSACSGGATNLTVGTSTITSGTTTRILYDNAGVVGEYTLTGSGTVVAMKTSPVLVTPDIGAATGTSLALTGGLTTGSATNSCDGTAGCFALIQGTAPSGQATTGIQHIAPTSVTSYRRVEPGAAETGILHLANSSNVVTETISAIASADLNITGTTCTNQFVSAISSAAAGTCTTATLAGAQFANQGTTTTVLHGNAAGNPSFGAIVAADITSATITGTQIASSIALAGSPTTTTQSGLDNSTKIATTAYVDAPVSLITPGTSITLLGNRGYGVCTGTCTVTVPVPTAGKEFCVYNDDNVATAITLSALGSSAMYENSARTAYGTAGTGTLVVAAAAKNKVCILGRDATHYFTVAAEGGAITVN